MENTLFYPAIFQLKEFGYYVYFPDIKNCTAKGTDIKSAYIAASENLGNLLSDLDDEGKDLPTPSSPHIKTSDNEFVAIIEFNLKEFRRKYNTRPVKKIIYIPRWLNDEAVAKKINISNLLLEALIKRIAN